MKICPDHLLFLIQIVWFLIRCLELGMQYDLLVKSWIYSSVSQGTNAIIIGLLSTREQWIALENRFRNITQSRKMELQGKWNFHKSHESLQSKSVQWNSLRFLKECDSSRAQVSKSSGSSLSSKSHNKSCFKKPIFQICEKQRHVLFLALCFAIFWSDWERIMWVLLRWLVLMVYRMDPTRL